MKFNKVEFFEKIYKKEFYFLLSYGGPLSYNNKIIKLLKKYKFDLSISVENRDITFKDLKTKYTLPRYNCNKFPYGKAFKNKFN